jgi:hypothetical protein
VTNFLGQPSRSSGLLTPERLVLLLPIMAGAALLLLVVLLGYPPLLLQWQQRREAISALLAQEAALPLLRGQIVASELQLQGKQQQQERLLTLVAGTGQLRTWLASLNDIAVATGVSVSFVEPGAVEVFVPPPPPLPEGQPADAAPVQAAAPVDPLLAPNLEKRSAQITLKGSYMALRGFLQQLEALQVVAIASELDLRAGAPSQPQPGQPALPPELKLKLSAYGRAPGKP